MNPRKFNLIAITLPEFFEGEAAAIAQKLLTKEFWRVHIRKPDADEASVRRLIEAIPAILRPHISLHDHLPLAQEYGLGGVHLNRRNPSPPQGWKGMVSRSLHSLHESAEGLDYAFLSPIFPSISKPGYRGDFTLDELAQHPLGQLFALGGVTPEKLPLLQQAGFGGAAMLGAAWRAHINLDHFRLQFITHPDQRFGVVEGARRALEGGCRWIQLRWKDATRAQLLEAGRTIASLCRRYGATFLVDDHVELVHELHAHGVHLGKNDMAVGQARSMLGPGKIIGATANTFDDIRAAAVAGADYLGVGPFRFTTTKQNLAPTLGLDGYRRLLQQCRREGIELPIVAIGGITEQDISDIMDTGVSGIAVSSAILSASDPIEQIRKFLWNN